MNTYKGIVLKGRHIGARLGFSTANVPLVDPSVSGIYASRVRIGEEEYLAAAFADQERKILEVHLLDFPARDLYGEKILIELHHKLRDSIAFLNDSAMREKIAEDIKQTREYFEHA